MRSTGIRCLIAFIFIQFSFLSHTIAALTPQGLLLSATRAGTRILVAGDHGRIFYSDDEGTSWKLAQAPTDSTLTNLFFLTPLLGWAVGYEKTILKTTDGGTTWSLRQQALSQDKPLFSIFFLNERQGVAVGAYGTTCRSTDGGDTWDCSVAQKNDDAHLYTILQRSDSSLLVAGETGTMFVSNNAGESWNRLHSPIRKSIFGGLTFPNGTVMVYGFHGNVWKSNTPRDGNAWLPVRIDELDSLFGGILLQDGRICLVGTNGTLIRFDEKNLLGPQHGTESSSFTGIVELRNHSLLLTSENGVEIVQ